PHCLEPTVQVNSKTLSPLNIISNIPKTPKRSCYEKQNSQTGQR
ncbi:MAG: hypothetical protein ACI9MB_000239, partial [Verrucomicrobiales bacterium]